MQESNQPTNWKLWYVAVGAGLLLEILFFIFLTQTFQ